MSAKVFSNPGADGSPRWGAFNLRALIDAVIGLAGFFVLATFSLSLSRFEGGLASIWLPNACAVAYVLLSPNTNRISFFGGLAFGSLLANYLSSAPLGTSVVFSLANVTSIATVIWIMRRNGRSIPDMQNLPDLVRLTLAGGAAGPAISAAVASITMGPNPDLIWARANSWFVTESLGMLLIVPTILLVFQSLGSTKQQRNTHTSEKTVLLLAGMAGVYLVMQNGSLPLLFLIPPITLLYAFRLGSMGTALFVMGLAIVTSIMTWAGYGPIGSTPLTPPGQVTLVKTFVAANYFLGLPIAAILAGYDRAVSELEAGKRELSLLANNITDAVLCYDLNGRCTYASPSVVDVLGRPIDSFVGYQPTNVTHKDARERIEQAQARLLNEQTDKERLTYRRFLDSEDGSPVYIEADCVMVRNPENGKKEGLVVSARDVTERVELELLLTRARRHAENAAQAKSDFLANMSHEIRTPMNGVLGFAELIKQSDLDKEQKHQVEMIVQSGRSMMLLLNDILDLSKIEAGQISIDYGSVDIHKTLEDCVDLHRPNAEKKKLKFHLEREIGTSQDGDEPTDKDADGNGDQDDWVLTDGLRVRQIVLNLIGNAVKFTETGLIHVSYSLDPGFLTIKVTDTGIGISPDRLDSIFAPFTQEESSTARRFGGTGLGLTISRKLASLLGGNLEVQSKAGVGSCFTLTLPVSPAEAVRCPLPEPAPITLEDLPHHARILLAEDHDVNRLLMTEMLERCGQTVAIAHDGNEAISMVIDSLVRGSPYDLVLMDIQMPGCDGYAATRAIRNEGIGPDRLPIIALTANAFPEDVAAARDAGMQAHLSKPLIFSELARALQRWLPTQIIESDPRDHVTELRADFASPLRENDAMRTEPTAPSSTAIASSPRPQLVASAPPHTSDRILQTKHSPALIKRWHMRREEAVEAVRKAIDTNMAAEAETGEEARLGLAAIIHKLAGTAGMFGEHLLGEQAAELEVALRGGASDAECVRLSRKLIEIADDEGEQQLSANGV